MKERTYRLNVFPKQGEALCGEYRWQFRGAIYKIVLTRESDALWLELRQKDHDRYKTLLGTKARLQYLYEKERLLKTLAQQFPIIDWEQLLSAINTQFYSLQSDWREYKDGVDPNLHWNLFEDCALLVPNTVNILYGPGGIGKGLITLAMLIRYVLPKHEVFYFDWENQGTGRQFFEQRFENICRLARLSQDDITHYRNRLRYYSGTDPIHKIVMPIYKIIERKQTEHAVLVVDSLSTALGENLNEQEPARRWMRFFNMLTNENITVWIQAHISKQDIRGGTGHAGPLGSRIFLDLARNAWEAKQPSEKEDENAEAIVLKPQLKVELVHQKSNFRPLQKEPLYFTYDKDGFLFSSLPF